MWDLLISGIAIWLFLYWATKPYPPMARKKGRQLQKEKAAALLRKKECCSDIETCSMLKRCQFGRPTNVDDPELPVNDRPIKPRIKGFIGFREPATQDCNVICLPNKIKKERETFVWNDEGVE